MPGCEAEKALLSEGQSVRREGTFAKSPYLMGPWLGYILWRRKLGQNLEGPGNFLASCANPIFLESLEGPWHGSCCLHTWCLLCNTNALSQHTPSPVTSLWEQGQGQDKVNVPCVDMKQVSLLRKESLGKAATNEEIHVWVLLLLLLGIVLPGGGL